MVADYSSGRIDMCIIVLKKWLMNLFPLGWLLGLGGGASWEIIGSYPHVVPIQVLCELGIVGFLAYAAVFGFSIRSFIRILTLGKGDVMIRSIACCIAALFFYRFLLSLKMGGLTSIYNTFIFPILLAKLESAVALEARNKNVSNYVRGECVSNPCYRPIVVPRAVGGFVGGAMSATGNPQT